MNILDGTEKFMRAAGQLDKPGFNPSPDDPVRNLRRVLLMEEHDEYLSKGEYLNDPVEIADGLLDQIVIAWGSMLAYFGPELARELADEVVQSNLSKILPDGTVLKREDGKVLKPAGYFAPQIRTLMIERGLIEEIEE